MTEYGDNIVLVFLAPALYFGWQLLSSLHLPQKCLVGTAERNTTKDSFEETYTTPCQGVLNQGLTSADSCVPF